MQRKVESELIFVERGGRQYPALITGFDDTGRIPDPRRIGAPPIPKMPAGMSGLPTLYTRGVSLDENGAPMKERGALVRCLEFKYIEIQPGEVDQNLSGSFTTTRPTGAPKFKRAVLDLLVHFRSGKRGPEWTFVPGVYHQSQLEQGFDPKRFWIASGEKVNENGMMILQ